MKIIYCHKPWEILLIRWYSIINTTFSSSLLDANVPNVISTIVKIQSDVIAVFSENQNIRWVISTAFWVNLRLIKDSLWLGNGNLWVIYPRAKILLLFSNFKLFYPLFQPNNQSTFVNNTAQLNIDRNKLNQKHILVISE